ncbi:Gfo/Idh/MocA family oxidoreductase [Paenibacillus thalictri]|uniref:Gfo/Idh/MocA family oxidoreductase n=2 Tax=Paenibacillus thalictri TaxID=2527873 RepID=A0A4Q9DP86_9BACL|nr:Gfo/Idh/MocA family oxidoreductase [Paenibacillus thalictri]
MTAVARTIRFGIIGAGLMGREFASVAARWCHLLDLDFKPEIVAVCDSNPEALDWFVRNVPTIRQVSANYEELLENPDIEAIYCAVPHHLHELLYRDIIRSGKHLLGEKPFGIDQEANRGILKELEHHPQAVVRCASEFPFFPGAYKMAQWVREGRFGSIIEVEAGFLHSSDLNPLKPINWKRRTATNGEYGCMGDLGVHVLHLPLQFGWNIRNVRALLSNIVKERPDGHGVMVPCDTWDNAILACEASADGQPFPMVLSMKRIDPGHANTWFIRVKGTQWSAEFSTQYPKQIKYMPYAPGHVMGWIYEDIPYASAYPTVTGSIFEFGFSDSLLQMWAAYCDELANGRISPVVRCVTPEQTAEAHRVFTAALISYREGRTVELGDIS